MSEQLRALATIQPCHTQIRTLLGGKVEGHLGINGLLMRMQENTAPLNTCSLGGKPLPVPLPELGGMECSVCVHSVSTC